jgi:uncharacterized protein YndB with AHSA1/START domain
VTHLLPLRRQVVVAAGAELAFGTFVDDIGAWWPMERHSVYGAGATVALRDRRLVETAPDGREADWGTVLDWDPPRRLRLTWHPGHAADRASEVEVSFVEVDEGQTLVTLEHRGWERFDDPAAARDEYSHGWPSVLAGYADRAGSADRAGQVAPAGGEVWLALMHTAGPARADGQSPFAHRDFGQHIAFLHRLKEDGLLVAAGSLDGSGEGMTVVRLGDATGVPELVRRAQEEDGSVVRGLFQVRVRPWRVALTG